MQPILFLISIHRGLVKSAIDMADVITESEIPVTAYVNKRALSAGAYIALQADHIYMAPGGKWEPPRLLMAKAMPLTKKLNHFGWQRWKMPQ